MEASVNPLTLVYGNILLAESKEEAEATLSPIVDDMVGWTCWCVTPSRKEVEVIVRKNCIVYALYEAGTNTAAKIAELLSVTDLSFLPAPRKYER